jgi:phosphoribosylamine---glycine ligase
LLQATATGRLASQPPLRWRDAAAVTVVVAAAGYPAAPRAGDRITGLEAIAGVDVLHAGTAQVGGELVTSGGRVLSVTAVAADLRAARQSAYAEVAKMTIEGSHFRTDIAAAAAETDSAAAAAESDRAAANDLTESR